jgi:thiol:disulfide interchange protein DsbC
MLGGPLVDVASRRNLSTAALEKVEREQFQPKRLAYLNELRDADAIVFPASQAKYRVTVFTDIDCGYCRELHRHKKAENVWCAADRKAALTAAKAGKDNPEKVCENPVADQFKAGEKLGVSGTPAILLDDGRLLPGYLPPEDLLRVLEKPAG